MQSPRSSYLGVTIYVLRCLKGSVGKWLFISSSISINLVGYAYSDWVGYPTTHRSTTDYFTILGSNRISWKTKKQPTISRSSTEVEHLSLENLFC